MNDRRAFIVAALALPGFRRRARAQADGASQVRYAALSRPVKIPLESVAVPWQPVPFVAEGMEQSRRVLISGVLFKNDANLSALCVTCPHEQCHVDLVTDQERLDRMLGKRAANPLFECGCHLSVFDAAEEGKRLSGESPRGLYRFRIAAVQDGMVEIAEIEQAALSVV